LRQGQLADADADLVVNDRSRWEPVEHQVAEVGPARRRSTSPTRRRRWGTTCGWCRRRWYGHWASEHGA
jgi:hypothetical protein